MYRVEYEKRVFKDLDAFPDRDVEKIVACIDALKAEPYPRGSCKLHGSGELYRVRQGDYRIVYSVHEKIEIIRVVKIGHRKDVYR